MRKHLFLASFLSFFISAICFGQDIGIKGTVHDQSGDPVTGASITVKGSTKASRSDANGYFSLSGVAPGAPLVITYLGYTSQTVQAEAAMTITLTKKVTDLNEVVVTALGIKKEKKALGYSITEVKGSDLTQARSVNIANSLEGKVAGLNITGTATGAGGSTRITIRGNASLGQNNQPLIVLDGIPMNNDNVNNVIGQSAGSGGGAVGMWGGTDQGDGISSLNPDEIESISVLKGGTAAALYGSRASNGAILVTTKSGGKKQNGIGIEVNSNFVAENLEYKKFNDYQYVYGLGDNGLKPTVADPNTQTNSWGAKLDGSPVIQFDGVSRPYSAVTDNLSKYYNTGYTFTNSVALAGGADKLGYRLSFADLNNKGIIPENRLIRDNIALSLNSVLSRRWSFNANIKYIKEKAHNRPVVSDSPGNADYAVFTMPTSLSVATLKQNMLKPDGTEYVYTNNQYVTNPYFAAEKFQRDDDKTRWITSFQPKFNITDNFYLKGLMGFDEYNFENTSITPTGTGFSLGGSYNRNLLHFKESNLGFILGYDKKFSTDFSLDVIGGGNSMRQFITGDNYSGGPFNIPFFYDISNVNPASVSTGHTIYEKRINSFYGSADIAFKDYLYLSLTARNDWFSALTPPAGTSTPVRNSIFYPSVGLSFILSEALKLPDFVNYAKVRTSWAQVGGDFSPYQLSLNYSLSGANNGSPLGQIGNSSVPNPALQPFVETTDEVGLEGRFLNNRLGLDFALYNKETSKDIISATISPASGYTGGVFNVGKINNKGIEVLLSYRVGNAHSFTWEPSVNLGYNASKVQALFGTLTQLTVDNPRTQTAFIAQEINRPFSELQVVAFKRDAGGNVIFNAAGLPEQAGAVKDMGSGISPLTMGFSNSFRYKSFNLSILLDARFGGYIFSGTQALAYRYGLAKETLPGRETGVVGKGVTESGTPNTVNVAAEAYYTNLYNFGEPFVFKSDFIKLRSVSLEYSVPARYLTGSFVRGVSFSVVGRNLLTLMKHTPNIDPESTYNNGNAQGLEFAGVPITRTMGLNLNLKF